jgi:adenosylcobinamide-GDP ribazoletransferase
VPGGVGGDGGPDFGRSAPAFPFVGAALGAVVGGVAMAMVDAFPDLVAAGAALGVALVLTGGLHADALADAADALGAGSREEALRIMRDPITGAFGTAAIVLVLLTEAAALAELAAREALGLIVAAFALSRAVAPALACLLRPARPGPSLATALLNGSRLRAGMALLAGVGVAFVCAGGSIGPLLVAALGVGLAVSAIALRRFGGATGDVLGSAVMLTEVACLVAATASGR